jgi:uncharacterized delta-60 repeat protein
VKTHLVCGWRFLLVAFILHTLAVPVGAQTIDGFDPGANGAVNAMAVQADGKILVAGAFTSLGGLSRKYLGRLNADGTIDAAFAPNFNGTNYSLVVQPDGRILVGGAFNMVDSQSRPNLARFDTNGVLDTAFRPQIIYSGPDGSCAVHCLALQSNGQILVGGNFSTLGGSNIAYLGRINADGTVDSSFDPRVSSRVYAIAVQTNGQILVGGDFHSVGGKTWSCLARLNADGTLDTNYVSVASGSSVRALALQPNGQLLVGGTFSLIGGQSCSNLIRLNDNGTPDASFTIGTDNTVNSLAVQADGRILVGGRFTALGDQVRQYIGRLTADGAVDAAFDPAANNYVNSLLPQAEGRLLVGGRFTVIGGQAHYYISRLEADGTSPFSFNPNPDGSVYALATQPDGKLLVGGALSSLAGQTRKAIGRFNADGTLDTVFNPIASGRAALSSGNTVYCFAVQPNGQILVGGDFTSLAGAFRYSLGRINADGSLDTNFNCAAGGNYPAVYCLLIQTNGQLLVGGTFSSLGGQTRAGLARLNADGTLDGAFNPGLSYSSGIPTARSLALQADGKIVLGGSFDAVGGQARNCLARLNANGSLDTDFSPALGAAYSSASSVLLQPDGKILVGGGYGFNGRLNSDGTLDTNFTATTDGTVSAMLLQTDGRIIVGGTFSKLNGVTNNCVGRFNSDGSLDTNFNAGLPAPSNPTYASVSSLALQPEGGILVGGSFSSLGGQTRTNLGRLNNTEPATQSLSSDGSTVLWLRGGTSPEVSRTTFETSADGVNWTNLGSGARTNGGWQLTGCCVSTNNLIRARGFLSNGRYNGSGSIVESLRAPLTILVNDGGFGFSTNKFSFRVRGTTGLGVLTEATTNLVDWVTLGTNVLGAAPLYVSDPQSANFAHRFYRIRPQP